jgi:hypothetical protein
VKIDTGTRVTLHFTGGPAGPFVEKIRAVSNENDRYELREHSTFAPLGPGDVVACDGVKVVEVVRLEPIHTVEATLHLPVGVMFGHTFADEHPAMRAVQECYEEWKRAAWVTRNTAFSFLVSSQTRDWLEDNVAGHRYVEHVDWVRDPDMRPALAHWLEHPNF